MFDLPIQKIRKSFDELLPSHHLVVEAETGSGKSTCLPLWAAEHGRVLVIEPRRIACTSLAEYLAEQSGEKLGQTVGYAIKLKAQYDEKTQVVFVTPGVALRWFSEDRLASFDIILVDEFHERRWDIDLLTSLLKTESAHRLIITSATLQAQRLAEYIGAKRLVSEGRTYPVHVAHHAKESQHLPSKKGYESELVEIVLAEQSNTDGDILVFLPGKKEIIQCAQMLQTRSDWVIAPLYASVSDEARDLALKQQAKRKVVLATNVAETSLTIPNVTLVIDSGLERRTIQRNGRTTLVLTAISKASAKQRAGRAGRTQEGYCIRMYGEHAALESQTPPELLREELIEATLAAASCGVRLSQLTFLDLLPQKSLQQAEQQLMLMGAINAGGDITEHGRLMYPLPIDALFADLVTRIEHRATKEAMIDLAAVLSTPVQLYRLPSGELLEELEKQEPFGCDAALRIRVVRGERFSGLEVDEQALQEARGLSEQMREIFELPQLEVASRFDRERLTQAIAVLHPELLFVRRSRRKEALGNGRVELLLGRNHRVPTQAEAMLVLDSHSVAGRGVKQTLNIATVSLPVPLAMIEALELGEWALDESEVIDNVAVQKVVLIYAGRVITSKIQQVQGNVAIEALVSLVEKDELLEGFASKRHMQIEHWKLYNKLGLGDAPTATDLEALTFATWFTEQLGALGVESADDLAIFDEDDFAFVGIPDWEYEEFAQKYPLYVALPELKLGVEYFPQRKLVQVIYLSGSRKGDPKRWELPRWQGWRVQYRKASRVLDIK